MPAVPRRGSLAVLDSGADAPGLSLQSQRIFRPSAGDGQGARSILVSLVRRANSGGETSRQRRRTTGHGRTDGLRREKREKDGIFREGQVFSMDTISGVCASCRQPARWVVTAIAMCNASLSSELASALKENSFGLKNYRVIRETQLESVATVVLLEGDTITVSLSPRGFEVGSLIGFLFFFASPSRSSKLGPGQGDRGRPRDTRAAAGFPQSSLSSREPTGFVLTTRRTRSR